MWLGYYFRREVGLVASTLLFLVTSEHSCYRQGGGLPTGSAFPTRRTWSTHLCPVCRWLVRNRNMPGNWIRCCAASHNADCQKPAIDRVTQEPPGLAAIRFPGRRLPVLAAPMHNPTTTSAPQSKWHWVTNRRADCQSALQGAREARPMLNWRFACLWSPSSRGPGHRPFTAVTRVRIPLGTPFHLLHNFLLLDPINHRIAL